MNKIKVAAYCRVSTDFEDQLNSLSVQISYFTEYINNHENYELIEVYYDEGITGTSTRKRDGFNRMIADCENGKINLILTKEVSRFARNTVDTLNYTRRLSELNIGVIFMNDGIDTRDKDGELRLTIMSSIAQEESRKISERVKWGMKRRMENGVVLGCGRIYGYKVVDGKLEIVPEEAEIVKDIFHQYLYEGKGSHTIAHDLSNRGIPTLKNRVWSPQHVLKILKNEKYAGDLTQWKVYKAKHQQQIDGIHEAIKRIRGVSECDVDNTAVYGEMVSKIIVPEYQHLDIYLNGIPFGFHLTYTVKKAPRIGIYDIIIDSCVITS